LSDYDLVRRRVLFEVWLPDEERVELRSTLCRSCGFMAYRPRPSPADVDAKYRFLQRVEIDIGGSSPSAAARRLDRARADRTFEAVARHADGAALDVLDFGGGDGKLLAPFLERGHRCGLVDYNVRPLEGVAKLGDTLDDLDADARFDAVICSHVLEHVSEPGATVRQLAGRLRPGGVVYAEVPVEIWRGIPIGRDPVTHLNFFTLGALEELFRRNGLEVVGSEQYRGSYAESRLEVATAVGRPGSSERPPTAADPAHETKRLLHPSLGMELARLWRERRLPAAGAVRRRLPHRPG
jgi:SAM-dependent methyltransferase